MVYVIDTNCLIYYFHSVFNQTTHLTRYTKRIIDESFDENSDTRLSIPSMVFVEIYDNFYHDKMLAKKIRYEVFEKIREAPIEIKEIDQEVLENLVRIKGSLARHEIHDKLILASAMALYCPLITTDSKITEYVKETRVIPRTLY